VRRIVKCLQPESLELWIALGSENWAPNYKNLQNPEKRDLHLSLLREQGFTCCYCGQSIELNDSHIEHFRPQSIYADLALAYENRFASCIRELRPGSPIICGHLKDEQFDEEDFLSPLDPDIERKFSSTLNGNIVGLSGSAEKMVGVLGLDQSFLVGRRSSALQSVFDVEFLLTASRTELKKIALAFRRIDADGKLAPFFHAIARFAERLLEALEVN
jgi:uncharacterized protein (TIGR02646 family)